MGAHPRDPWSITAPLAGPSLTKPIRVAVAAEPPGGSTDPVIANVVRRAADALTDAGYEVVNACPPRYEEAIACWAKLWSNDFAAIIARLLPLLSPDAATFFAASTATSHLRGYFGKARSRGFRAEGNRRSVTPLPAGQC